MMFRSALFTAAVLGGSLVLAPAPFGTAEAAQVNGPKVAWNLSTYTRGRGITSLMDEGLAPIVSKATDGNFEIKIHYSGTLSPAKENLDGLSIGAFELALVTPSFHPGKTPALTVFDLPFLPLGDLKVQARTALAFFALPEIEKEGQQWNTRIYLPGLLPTYKLMGKGKPPHDIADLRGQRVRALGGVGQALRRIGMVPTSMSSPEIYGALERGLIDSATFPSYALYTYKIYEIADWYTTNMSIGIGASFLGASTAAWNKLPPQYQKLLMDAIPGSIEAGIKAYDDIEGEGDAAFRKKPGLTAITYSEETLKALVATAAQPVWDEWIADIDKKGYDGKKLLNFVLTEARRSGS